MVQIYYKKHLFRPRLVAYPRPPIFLKKKKVMAKETPSHLMVTNRLSLFFYKRLSLSSDPPIQSLLSATVQMLFGEGLKVFYFLFFIKIINIGYFYNRTVIKMPVLNFIAQDHLFMVLNFVDIFSYII